MKQSPYSSYDLVLYIGKSYLSTKESGEAALGLNHTVAATVICSGSISGIGRSSSTCYIAKRVWKWLLLLYLALKLVD